MILRVITFVIFYFFTTCFAAGQNCPLNTPEFPFEVEERYSWSSNLYLPSQVGGSQTFNDVTFRVDNAGGGSDWDCTFTDLRVYMRHTTVDNFPNGNYPGTAGFTLVYDGSITIDDSGNTSYTVTFDTPFVYNGIDQLELLIENRTGIDCDLGDPWFDRTDESDAGVYPGKVGFSNTSWADATSFGSRRRFNLAIAHSGCGSYPLPVELLYLKPSCSNDVITLDWATASETNNSHFTFYGSHDGRNFDKLLRIEGRGNTMMTEKYQAVVENTEGYQYVKMVQEDFDGTRHEYSPKTIKCESKQELDILRTFPNPSNQGHFSLELSAFDHADVQVQLTTVDGRTVHGQVYQVNKGLNLLEIQPGTSLKPGLYILTVTYNNKVMDQEKIVVSR